MVNLEWYRTFKAIYNTGTLTGAAEALFISQPGVSVHLSALESYVGYKLFERTGRKMLPTERAKALYNAVYEPLLKLEEAEKTFQKSTEKHKPTITVGMCFEMFQATLEKHLSKLPFNVIACFGQYPEMLDNLDKGIIDLVVTPQKGDAQGVVHEPFSYETIVLVGGSEVKATELHNLLYHNDKAAAERWLKAHKWYGTTGDMEHLFRFWELNFGHRPDFRPNFIVPNLNSIVRCLSDDTGLAVMPDFLCHEEINSGKVKLVWGGEKKLQNTLYFGCRKNTLYHDEIAQLKDILRNVMPVVELV
ncbi:LysR family transcriptional regulator [Flavobacterium sp. RHBU_3]|uniref:LysR family transcriptional regulator n=1 Tax=Flavobacterium sp. RHBU_3 TaxID=3391184 RepID=UPI003984BE91